MTTVLTIAGSDPSGGAGVQADLRTFDSFGAKGLSVITAITSQSEDAFLSSFNIPSDILLAQLLSFKNKHDIDAIKIGMIGSLENLKTIAAFLEKVDDIPVVLDPVLCSSTSFPLLEEKAISSLSSLLFQFVSVVTPNISEASILSGLKIDGLDGMADAAKTIYEKLAKNNRKRFLAVIVKGGHLEDRAVDLVYDGKTIEQIESKQASGSIHGSGCAYSSALAIHLAKGKTLKDAARKSKEYVAGLISRKN